MLDEGSSVTSGRYLYYYASLETLRATLQSGKIWLSDIRKSNDSDEVLYGIRQIKHRLEALLDADKGITVPADHLKSYGTAGLLTPYDIAVLGRRLSLSLGEVCAQISSKRNMNYGPFGGRRCFALCFTGDGDLLSQWRGYGDDGRGIAIGFRKPTLLRYVQRHASKAVPGETLRFKPVYYREMDNVLQTYDKESLRQERFLLRRFEVTRGHLFRENEMAEIDRLLFELLLGLKTGHLSSTDGKVVANRVARRCENLAPLLKHPMFYEEREERIFVWANPDEPPIASLANPQGRDVPALSAGIRQGSKLALHLELPILSKDRLCDDDHIAIGRVVLGPRCEADHQDVRTLLREFGYQDCSIDILDSGITYVG